MKPTVPKVVGYAPGTIRFRVLQEVIRLASAAQIHDLTNRIPLGAIVLAVAWYWEGTIPSTANTRVGVGRKTSPASPAKYGNSPTSSQNFCRLQQWANPIEDVNGEELALYAVNSSGATSTDLSIGGTSTVVDVELQITIAEPVYIV